MTFPGAKRSTDKVFLREISRTPGNSVWTSSTKLNFTIHLLHFALLFSNNRNTNIHQTFLITSGQSARVGINTCKLSVWKLHIYIGPTASFDRDSASVTDNVLHFSGTHCIPFYHYLRFAEDFSPCRCEIFVLHISPVFIIYVQFQQPITNVRQPSILNRKSISFVAM